MIHFVVFGHVCRLRSTHTAPIPFPAGSVHAHTNTKPSRAGAVVSRSQLVDLGAAMCVGTGLCWVMVVKTEPTIVQYHKVCCFFSSAETQLYEHSQASCARPKQRSGHVPKTCCRLCCQARPPTDERTEKPENICDRCCTAVLRGTIANRTKYCE